MKKKSIPIPEEVALQEPQHRPEDENYSLWDEDDPVPEEFRVNVSEILTGVNENAEPVELTVTGLKQGERLDKWLAAQLTETSRSRLQQWITAGHVRVNGLMPTLRQTVWNYDVIVVQPQLSAEQLAFQPEAMALDIVYEDATLLVLNKPAGLVVHPAAGNWSGTLLNGLLHHAPQLAGLPRAGIVHRLDKDTSGLMVVAKTLNAQTHLVRQLQARSVKREYLALVHGAPPETGTVNAPIGRHSRDRVRMAAFKPIEGMKTAAKPAVTHFRVLQRRVLTTGAAVTLVCCKLETGRTHQIRVHMQSIGFPLVGDALYGQRNETISFARQALHAWQLGLLHPETDASCLWRCPAPPELTALFEQLGFDALQVTADAS